MGVVEPVNIVPEALVVTDLDVTVEVLIMVRVEVGVELIVLGLGVLPGVVLPAETCIS